MNIPAYKHDTTSEQERLEELTFRLSLYRFVEYMAYGSGALLMLAAILVVANGLFSSPNVLMSYAAAVCAVFVFMGRHTRYARSEAESEIRAIWNGIGPIR